MVEEFDKLFDFFFSEDKVGFNADHILAQFAKRDPKSAEYYDAVRQKWPNVPRAAENCEEELAQCYEKIADAVQSLSPNKNGRRMHWSAAFADTPVPDPRCCRKPDLVVVDKKYTGENSPGGWRDIFGTIEIKSGISSTIVSKAMRQIREYTRLIFQYQPNRRYVLNATLLENAMRLVFYDRSGVIASCFFDIHEKPKLFLQVIVGLLRIDSSARGFDPTVTFDTMNSGTIEVGNVLYRFHDVLHVEGVIRGRGTTCYKVLHNGENLLVKDSWVDRSRELKESTLR